MTTTTKITLTALQQLQAELYELSQVRRPEAVQALKDAREQGDLSENADFTAASEQVYKISTRITELQNIINNAEIIEITGMHTYVELGATVTFKSNNIVETVTFVDPAQLNPFKNQLSTECALYKAMKGMKVGNMFKFYTRVSSELIQIIGIQ